MAIDPIEALQEFYDEDPTLRSLLVDRRPGESDEEKSLREEVREEISFFEDHEGANALHYAVEKTWYEAIPVLLELGLNINKAKDIGEIEDDSEDEDEDEDAPEMQRLTMTPLQMALEQAMFLGDERTMQYLSEYEKDVNRRSLKCAKVLIDRGANLELRNEIGETPVIFATKYNIPILEDLIAKGANVNATDSFGNTALHNASNQATVKLLVSAGANVNKRNTLGMTPLERSIANDFVGEGRSTGEVLAALLEEGADFNLQNGDGDTVRQIIEENGNDDQLSVLENFLESVREQRRGEAVGAELVGREKNLAADTVGEIKGYLGMPRRGGKSKRRKTYRKRK